MNPAEADTELELLGARVALYLADVGEPLPDGWRFQEMEHRLQARALHGNAHALGLLIDYRERVAMWECSL